MLRNRSCVLSLLLLCLLPLLVGCWDKVEVEDQLFPAVASIDKGERHRYRVMVRIPVAAASKAGVLGGEATKPFDSEIAEGDSLEQVMLVMNSSMARVITMRHIRGVVVGEALAREGIFDLLAELRRNAEIYLTAGFWVAHGNAIEVQSHASPTGEVVAAKISEGIILVEKRLHMAPPVRVHQMIVRTGTVGADPFAPVVGANEQILGKGEPTQHSSAVAGEMDRFGKNALEMAGTAVFREDHLAGFLTVDETQMLLALRGEMGKAYVTIADPSGEATGILIRFHQENKPYYQVAVTPAGPRVTGRLLFEGEVLTGNATYRDPQVRGRLEKEARAYMARQIRSVLDKTTAWQSDPIAFGARFRSKFPTWEAWLRFNWRSQIPRLKVQVTTDMRIRRTGMIDSRIR